ncbi:MAG: DUF2235 domain-containing protein [Planctomycetota bacterium]|jgi:uncharacterized protein (DUF2235 family)
MEKNIILCSDGTGNRGGKGRDTNVWKIFKAIDRHGNPKDSKYVEQITFYDDGVGTEDFKLFRIMGGAFGWGLSRNVRELYTFLAKNYEIGDRIYLFGFSRGAYTVRLVAGMIGCCGILDWKNIESEKDRSKKVKEAFRIFKKDNKKKAEQFLKDYDVHTKKNDPECPRAKIRMVGVWDTVDAVGVPFDWLREIISWIWKYRFRHNRLGNHVEYGYHALAIDDERKTFHPEMWDLKKEEQNGDDAEKTDPVIEQVWFPGVHSNVGGGYPKNEMALLSLDWMMGKAEELGIRFMDDERKDVRDESDPYGKLYDARAGLAAYYRYCPRNIQKICEKSGVEKPQVHVSVLDRIERKTACYGPLNLNSDFNIVPTDDEKPPPGEDKADIVAKKKRFDEKKTERTSLQASSLWYVNARKFVYYTFLLTTLFLLGSAAYLGFTKIDDTQAPAETDSGQWKESLIEFLVPDFLERLVVSIIPYPEIWITCVAIFLFLLLFKLYLVSKMKEISLRAWALAPAPDKASTEEK